MKILVVGPVPTYATWDVWVGQIQGLQAAGAEVFPLNYSTVWNMYADFKEFMEVTGRSEYDTIHAALMAGDRVVTAAIAYEVDLVHFVSPMHISPVTLEMLQKYLGLKTSAYFTECPYDDDYTYKMAEVFDYCFVCDRESVPVFGELNPKTMYIGHSYNPEIHMPEEVEQDVDVLFIGTNFPTRVTFLEAVDWKGIDFQLRGVWNVGNKAVISQYIQGKREAVKNVEAINLYRRARINLQLHRKDGYNPANARRGKRTGPLGGLLGATPKPDLVAYSLGPRSFELAACGAFQVSDAGRPELEEIFGDSVPTYSSPEDLGSLVRTFLDDPVRRDELAKRQLEAIQPYTFEKRMRVMLDAVA